MHDVVLADREREGQVRADSDGDAHPTAAGDRNRGADRNELRVRAVRKRAPAREQVARARRGREDGDGVPERTQLSRHSRHVLVDVVRLRPRERRDEADS